MALKANALRAIFIINDNFIVGSAHFLEKEPNFTKLAKKHKNSAKKALYAQFCSTFIQQSCVKMRY